MKTVFPSHLLRRLTDLVGKHASLFGKRTGLVGKRTGLIGRRTSLIGRHTDLVGKRTDLVGRHTDLVGKLTDLVGKRTSLKRIIISKLGLTGTWFLPIISTILGCSQKLRIQEVVNMPAKPYPTDVLEQAQSVLDAMNQIDSGMNIGSVNNATLSADITQANQLVSQMNALEAQLTNMRNQRDTLYAALWDKVKRVRSGVKANYGDDSSQYEMVGGTRLSERKSPTRKTTTTA